MPANDIQAPCTFNSAFIVSKEVEKGKRFPGCTGRDFMLRFRQTDLTGTDCFLSEKNMKDTGDEKL